MIYLAVGFLSAATVPLRFWSTTLSHLRVFFHALDTRRTNFSVLLFAVEQCRFLTRHAAIIPRSFVRSRSLVRSQRKFSSRRQFERSHRRRPLTSSRLFSAVDTLCLTFLYLAEKVRTMSRERERKKRNYVPVSQKDPKDLNATALHERRRNFGRCVWNDLETVEIKRSP